MRCTLKCPCFVKRHCACHGCKPGQQVPSGCDLNDAFVAEQLHVRGLSPGGDPLEREHPLRNAACREIIERNFALAQQFAGSIRMVSIPAGPMRKQLALEYAKCITAAAEAPTGPEVEYALKVAYLLPWFLAQKPGRGQKGSLVCNHLQRDLNLWRRGALDDLAARAKMWAFKQRERFARRPDRTAVSVEEAVPMKLATAVQEAVSVGKLARASQVLLEAGKGGGPLRLDAEVKRKLEALHPAPLEPVSPAPPEARAPPGVYDEVDGGFVRTLVTDLRGAPGPSGWTTDITRKLCRDACREGDLLCDAIAALTRRVAESELLEGFLGPLTCCRLVALEKGKGGVRPVGVGEALRRLICKAISRVARAELQAACGAMQTCGGVAGGCEAAARVIQRLWEEDDTECVVLIDATNAFNSVSRAQALRATWGRCPALGRALQNLYGCTSALLLEDGSALESQEGTTQGCPLGMAMFAVASMPLIARAETPRVRQVWFADDGAGGGQVVHTRRWFDALKAHGPGVGYHMNLSKTVALVKPGAHEAFLRSFEGLTDPERGGMTVVSLGDGDEGQLGAELGRRYLGAGVGSRTFRESFVREKVAAWCREIRSLAAFSKIFPHEGYCLLVRTLVPRWRYVMRTMEVDPALFEPLEDTLVATFFPAAFGWVPDQLARARSTLPVRHGGLGIPRPSELAVSERGSSATLTAPIESAIWSQDWSFRGDRKATAALRQSVWEEKDRVHSQEVEDLLKQTTGRARRAFEEARVQGGRTWLAAIPLECHGLALPRQTFRDAVALRMGVPLPDPLPSVCPSCGEPFSLQHALKCKKGGWVVRRHREVLLAWASLFERVASFVEEEPALPLIPGVVFSDPRTTTDPAARADIMARGVFQPQTNSYYDTAVIDTAADSYVRCSVVSTLASKERLKRRKYDERVRPLGTFTPLVCSVYGTLGGEAEKVLTLVTSRLKTARTEKRDAAFLLRVCLSAAVVKATSVCLRERSHDIPTCDAFPEVLADSRAALSDLAVRQAE